MSRGVGLDEAGMGIGAEEGLDPWFEQDIPRHVIEVGEDKRALYESIEEAFSWLNRIGRFGMGDCVHCRSSWGHGVKAALAGQ